MFRKLEKMARLRMNESGFVCTTASECVIDYRKYSTGGVDSTRLLTIFLLAINTNIANIAMGLITGNSVKRKTNSVGG